MINADLTEFIACYNPKNRHERKDTWSEKISVDSWHRFSIEDIEKYNKTSLDIFGIKDKSIADLDNISLPDILANDIIENLQSALESFQSLKGQ